MDTCRLIYRSIATAEVVSNETLRQIEETASRNNGSSGVTGLLVLADNVFVQVLEGSPSVVNALYLSIAADKRHRQVQLVTYEPQVQPLFTDWSMRLVDLYDLPGEKRLLMADKYGDGKGGIRVPSELQQVYALLFDARYLCGNTPWRLTEVDSDEPAAERKS
jgi:hypothetical protein